MRFWRSPRKNTSNFFMGRTASLLDPLAFQMLCLSFLYWKGDVSGSTPEDIRQFPIFSTEEKFSYLILGRQSEIPVWFPLQSVEEDRNFQMAVHVLGGLKYTLKVLPPLQKTPWWVLVKEELKLFCISFWIEVYYFLKDTVHIRDVLLSHSRRS